MDQKYCSMDPGQLDYLLGFDFRPVAECSELDIELSLEVTRIAESVVLHNHLRMDLGSHREYFPGIQVEVLLAVRKLHDRMTHSVVLADTVHHMHMHYLHWVQGREEYIPLKHICCDWQG